MSAQRLVVVQIIGRAISEETKIPQDQLRADEPFESYGIESVMSVSITRRLEESFGDLSKTLLFEYQSIDSLADYFVADHAETIGRLVATPSEPAAPLLPPPPVVSARPAPVPAPTATPAPPIATAPPRPSRDRDDIAIIGIAGRFPGAPDLDALWKRLERGDDCITEIPERLWDWRDYWDAERGTRGKSYSRWGGFIEDADRFDPLFFNISPLEAEAMDPQERVFLETVHHTLEDAGYVRDALRVERVGLYVSVMWGPYQHYGTFDGSAGSSYSTIANRASYYFDLRGPSIALDTMCSGSMTTIHLACESLRSGESTMALAGGVNITSHPNKYIVLSRMGFASADGRCRSFAPGGTGYVPSDGVGTVLLKPLSRAEADGDRIHAVIKSTTINHGGKASGYTVPSAEAQASLIEAALAKAAIDPRTISYVEAHAPGTSLGDPIEVRGLTSAFRKHTAEVGYCPIGSVKANIGHLESAAAFASLAKVLLQLRHRAWVPSIHCDAVNPNIHFETTPFFIQRELAPWPARIVDGVPAPRRAAINSFGAGGSNAHMIVEEYIQQAPSRSPAAEHAIVLSAKTGEQLRGLAANLLAFIGASARPAPHAAHATDTQAALLDEISRITGVTRKLLDPSDRLCDLPLDDGQLAALGASRLDRELTIDELLHGTMATHATQNAAPAVHLERIAYTLQVGREAMLHRFATVVSSLEDLIARLECFLNGGDDGLSSTGTLMNAAIKVASAPADTEYVTGLVRGRRLRRLAQLWCTGVAVPWQALYDGPRPARIALPLYPFARDRCWIAQPERAAPPSANALERELATVTYRAIWEPSAWPQASSAGGAALVVAARDSAATAHALERLLDPGTIYSVSIGEHTQVVSQRAWELAPTDTTGFSDVLRYIDRLRRVYYVCAPAEAARDADRAIAEAAVFLRLVQALHRATSEPLQLTLVTCSAHPTGSGERIQPRGAILHGLARVAARELHRFTVTTLDLGAGDDHARSLGAALCCDGGRRAIRGNSVLEQRLAAYASPAATGPAFRPDGVYVLVGGAGSVGRLVTAHIGRSGGHVAWIGRRTIDDDIRTRMREAEAAGASVSYYAADVTEVSQLRRAFDAIERERGMIDGVVQLATALEMRRLEAMPVDELERLLAPKVRGSSALQDALHGRGVRFVALFSSAESFFGSVGRAAYSAACCYQDAFARDWQATSSGERVALINWGFWEGLAQDVAEMLAAKGIRPLRAAVACAALDRAICGEDSQLVVMDVDRAVLERTSVERAPAATSAPRPSLPTLDPASAPALDATVERLTAIFSRVLKIPVERFGADVDLVNYGVDSLIVINLQKALEVLTGPLPATLLLEETTIRALAGRLSAEYPAAVLALGGAPVPAAVAPAVAPTAGPEYVLRVVERGDIATFLDRYGELYRAHGIIGAAERPMSTSLNEGAANGLVHAVVRTSQCERVEVIAAGSGVPVVLLPAVGLTAPSWRYQLESSLTVHVQLAVIHAPGYGVTSAMQGANARGVTAVIHETISQLWPKRRVHVVGSCLGSVWATALARFYPEQVASLTLVGAFHDSSDLGIGDPDTLTVDQMAQMGQAALQSIRDDFAALVRRGADRVRVETALETVFASQCANSMIALRYLHEMLKLSLFDWLSGIVTPTQCVYGELDAIVDPRHSRAICAGIPGASLEKIPEAAHFPYLTHPADFNERLLSFVLAHEANGKSRMTRAAAEAVAGDEASP